MTIATDRWHSAARFFLALGGFTYSMVIHDWSNITSFKKALAERIMLHLGEKQSANQPTHLLGLERIDLM